jgi:hypothetical protein
MARTISKCLNKVPIFHDENPGPARATPQTVHFDQCLDISWTSKKRKYRGEESTKTARELGASEEKIREYSCGREENSGTDSKLVPFVPAGQIIVDTWKKPGLKYTQEYPANEKLVIVSDVTH